MGVGKALQIVTEPEAAAIWALQQAAPYDLDIGDTFIVCDAGGGTVDLISYTIKALSPLRVTEAAPGDGGVCGSIFLNRRFESFLLQKLGGHEAWDEEILEEVRAALVTPMQTLVSY